MTLEELYGNFNPISHEWYNGVLANAFREFSQCTSPERKWFVFDGPVDDTWIEDLNTVLDDNKKLCLMSGEVITIHNLMTIIFEATDLKYSSPSTLARCGIIYLETSETRWKMFLESYKNTLKNQLLAEQLDLVTEIIEWLFDPIVNFIGKHCETFISLSHFQMFSVSNKYNNYKIIYP